MFGFVVNGRVVMTGDSYHHCVGIRDGERAGYIRHIIVALHGIARRRDSVGAFSLSRLPVQRVADDTCRIAVMQTGNRGGELRIIISRYLLFVIGCDRCGGACDGKRAGLVGYRIIALLGIASGRDDVSVGILAGFATQ